MIAAARLQGRAWVGDAPLFAPVDLELATGRLDLPAGPLGRRQIDHAAADRRA
jgi:hypothetical protein